VVPSTSQPNFAPEDLEAIVDEATIDCYNFEEELSSWGAYLGDELEFPCEVLAIGKKIQVIQVEERLGRLKFGARVGGKRYWIDVTDVEVADTTSRNAKLLAAYRHWLGGEA